MTNARTYKDYKTSGTYIASLREELEIRSSLGKIENVNLSSLLEALKKIDEQAGQKLDRSSFITNPQLRRDVWDARNVLSAIDKAVKGGSYWSINDFKAVAQIIQNSKFADEDHDLVKGVKIIETIKAKKHENADLRFNDWEQLQTELQAERALAREATNKIHPNQHRLIEIRDSMLAQGRNAPKVSKITNLVSEIDDILNLSSTKYLSNGLVAKQIKLIDDMDIGAVGDEITDKTLSGVVLQIAAAKEELEAHKQNGKPSPDMTGIEVQCHGELQQAARVM